MTDLYAVFGNPVAHSRSPQIHALFAEQLGEDIHYERVLAPLNDFPAAVRNFVRAGGCGFNVTVPFKEEAWRLARRRTLHAEKSGAVNTVSVGADGFLVGDNTDGIGMVNDITRNLGWPLRGQRVLVLGAGGAVRGVLGPLLAEQPAVVTIVNRTAEKAMALAQLFADEGAVEGLGYDGLNDTHPWDVIINGTSASLSGQVPNLPPAAVGRRTRGYDMMYAREPTAFLHWAMTHGAGAVSDGLGMLVEQAAEAYVIWRGRRPDTASVIAALRG